MQNKLKQDKKTVKNHRFLVKGFFLDFSEKKLNLFCSLG
jgi:hypothetical protein